MQSERAGSPQADAATGGRATVLSGPGGACQADQVDVSFNNPDSEAVAGPAPRLLIVKFGAIGDVLMAIPGAAAMHRQGYRVDWLTGQAVAPVLRLYPWIRVMAVDEAALLGGTKVQRLRATLALWRELRAGAPRGGYDLLATLYYDRRYQLLTSLVRAKRRIRLSESDRRTRLLPGRHHTDEYARILAGRPDGEVPAQLAPVPAPLGDCLSQSGLAKVASPRGQAGPRVVLVPAGARNLLRDDALRRWSIASYVALARLLLRRGCEVLLVGGPEDQWASPHFAELEGETARGVLTDEIGRRSLVETLALLDSAEVTVTHDTGPLHLAGITSTSIVTIFGPTDPHGRLPQRGNCVALWGGEGFACRPCYDGRNYADCAHNGCMDQVTPGAVMQQVEELIQARAEGRSLPPRVLTPGRAPLIRLDGAASKVGDVAGGEAGR